MNPPPLPETANPSSTPRKLAFGSLLMPLLVIVVAILARAAEQGTEPLRLVKVLVAGLIVVLVIAGFVCALVALGAIPRHGTRGILVRAVVGLVLNGTLVIIFLFALLSGFQKGLQQGSQSRQALRDLQSASDDMHRSMRESFDPEHGITNRGAGSLDRLSSEFENASQTMSGDDALIMQCLGSYVAELQQQLKAYEAAATELVEGELLDIATLTNKSQIEERRAIAKRFLEANAELKGAIANSEPMIRTKLAKARVPQAKIEVVIKGYKLKAVPRQTLTLQIRECDRRIGSATLGALDLLESQWGRWQYESAANEITFNDSVRHEAYVSFLNELNEAGEKQVKLQGLLLEVP